MAGQTRSTKAPAKKRRRDELILDALAKLLVDTPLRDLGVEEIADEAGITRTRFYFYYKSKYEALAALLTRVADEILDAYSIDGGWFDRPPDKRPREAFLETMTVVFAVWQKNAVIVREAADLWNAVPDVRQRWEEVMRGLVERMKGAIEREREVGVAPPGPPAQRLAEILIWAGERQQFLWFIESPHAMSLAELAEHGSVVVMRSVYLADDPDPQVTA